MLYRSATNALLLLTGVSAFSTPSVKVRSTVEVSMAKEQLDGRRTFLSRASGAILVGLIPTVQSPKAAEAVIYLDPAMYGDQENRLSAVDSLKEGVRRAILQNPDLTTSFYTLALLDALSYNAKTGEGGPDGRIITAVLESKENTPYINNLKAASQAIVDTKKSLKKLTSITIADAVALGGTEAVEAVGGPNLSIQVGRTDALKGAALDKYLPLDLFEGKRPVTEVAAAFKRSGLTEREMTALMSCLLTLEKVDKSGAADWKTSDKAAFRERGKMGRMSEFKKLTDEDIANELAKDGLDDEDDEPGLFDDQPYIADSFGTREQSFGKKASNMDAASFNKYLKELDKFTKSKTSAPQDMGWIGELLLSKDTPGTQTWVAKYAQSTLNYQKDLGIAFNSMSQLGAEYTGGKYENLLKNKPRKTLNDFD
jgi:hypothetical protein